MIGSLLCLLGRHDWGSPRISNSLTLSGEQTEDGWKTKTSDDRYVAQWCQREDCWKSRKRNDLRVEDYDDE